MAAHDFTLFATAIGRCAIAWGGRGIVSVHLPEATDAATRARVHRRSPEAREATPPPDVQRAIDAIVALLEGHAIDLSPIALDMDGVPLLHRKVYAAARAIAPGTTTTYGDLAARIGDRRLAREVGQALARNPFAIVVPCHRVVAAGGKIGGFTARGGIATKLRLLAIERAGSSPLHS